MDLEEVEMHLKVIRGLLEAHSEAIDANYVLIERLTRRIEILELRLNIEEPKERLIVEEIEPTQEGKLQVMLLSAFRAAQEGKIVRIVSPGGDVELRRK